ncbi:MAG TPA: phospholipase D family protein [Burkholderiales bacterium]
MRDTDGTRLGRMASEQAAAHPGLSGAYPLSRGRDAFLARLALAETAERSLDVQYYIWRNDTTGRVLLDHLVRAAGRGVRVRLLIDDLGTAPNDAHLLLIDGSPNIEVRLFNPIASRGARLFGTLTDFGRVNRRMHNKSFTADGQATIVGGRNVGDEYFEAASDLDFADMDVLAIGPVVKQVADSFDLYWNSPAAIPIAALASKRVSEKDVNRARAALAEYGESQRAGTYADALRNSKLAQNLRTGSLTFFWGKAEALYDDPAKITQSPQDQGTHLLPKLAKITDATQGELLIISPYFIPGKAGVDYFKHMRARGVHVVILTNSLAATDVSAVHAGYSRYRRALLESGVELYEVKATARRPGEEKTRGGSGPGLGGSSRASLHAKVFLFDRKVLFVGSLNLDPRSASLNTEIGLVFETPELAAQGAADLMAGIAGATYRLALVPPEAAANTARRIEWIEQDNGQEVRHHTEPQAGIWRRIGVWFLSWLPIESQL